VGYKIGGGDHKCSKEAAITFCTVGYLLENLSHHPDNLQHYSHIVLDEANPAPLHAAANVPS
jgi:HrpA-like RNA helicase